MTFITNRRNLLAGAGLVIAGAGASADTSRAAQGVPRARPSDVGRKFLADGRVRPFLGNTIICHVPQQDAGFATFDALLDIVRDLPGYTFSRKLAVLPPSSYHMTIFGGANDQDRTPGLWPTDLPLDLPMSACDAALAERLVGFDVACELPIRMRIDTAPQSTGALSINLLPVDAAEETKLRLLRDRLSTTLKIRAPDHDRYGFHMTIAYQIDWLTDREQQEFDAARVRWFATLRRKIPILSFGAPEYCTLRDMFAFRRRLFLV